MALGALTTKKFPRLVGLLLLGAGLLSAGCFTPGQGTANFWPAGRARPEDTPHASVQQIHGTWENNVLFDADVVNAGKPHPGLRGRLYLFGKEMGYPIQARGELFVDLYDLTQRDKDGKPKMLERWHYGPDALSQRLQKDIIGWGYSLFLPWDTYRPDLTQVSLTIFFVPEGGQAVYAPAVTLALQPERAVTISSLGVKGQGSGVRGSGVVEEGKARGPGSGIGVRGQGPGVRGGEPGPDPNGNQAPSGPAKLGTPQ